MDRWWLLLLLYSNPLCPKNLKSVWCCNCLQALLFRCFNALTLTSHYYRQWFAHFWFYSIWRIRLFFQNVWLLTVLCMKWSVMIVNITDESALYYATLPMILWTWCKIWYYRHDGLYAIIHTLHCFMLLSYFVLEFLFLLRSTKQF